ncbi:YncE family protein [Mycobacterium sp. MS1601]|uniref:YncE family protein n=1 Tax=Mycobacterium sp. MS1601 TaxID=1936029 RepID=UPI0012F8CC73|nr:hypothetical protein [Mycobacterium sp. MS1601]
MGSARYIGRVGALAVALGIGMVVTNSPAIALAEDSAKVAPSADNDRSDVQSPEKESTPENDSPSDEPSEDDDTDDSAEVDDADADGEDEGDEVDEGDDDASEDAASADDEDVPDEDDSTSGTVTRAPTVTVTERRLVEQNSPEPQEVSATAESEAGLEADTATETKTEPTAATDSGNNPDIVTAAAEPLTVTIPTVAAAVVAPANPVQTFVTSVLSWFGFAPHAGTAPASPASNPTAWAVLAWIRREIGYTFFNRSPVLDPVKTGQTAAGEVTGDLNGKDFQGAALTYSGSGSTPKGSVVIDPATGAFTYTPGAELAAVGGTDTFTVTASNTAAYRLPGVAGMIQGVIHQGAQLLGLAQSDATSTVVEVSYDVNGLTVITEIRTAGTPVGLVMSSDGTRAYRTSEIYDATTGEYRTRVTVVDTNTGAVLGAPVTLVGRPGDFQVSKDGTRVVQTSEAYHEDTDSYTTTVVVIDSATGDLVGSRFVIEAHRAGHLQLSDDSTRAFQTTQTFDENNRVWFTELTVINTTTGTLVGTPIVVDGSFRIHTNDRLSREPLVFSADGTRAYMLTQNLGSGVDATKPQESTLAVIDIATGTLVDTPVTVDGHPAGPLALSKDGTRVYAVTTVDIYFTNTATARVAVVDAHTGALIGDPLVLNGYAVSDSGSPDTEPVLFFSPDGSRAFVSTNVWDPVTFAETTRVAMFDATDGTLLHTTVLEGRARGTLQRSTADPTRFVQVTVTDFGTRIEPATTQLATINAEDGTLIGTAHTRGIDDNGFPVQFNPTGTRAYLLTVHRRGDQHEGPADAESLYLTVIDTATGQLVGEPIELRVAKTVEDGNGSVQFSADGTRAFQLVQEKTPSGVDWSTRMLVIDTGSGALLNTVELPGPLVGHGQDSDDGHRVYLTTATKLMVIDSVTGALVSATTLPGTPVAEMTFAGNAGEPGYLAVTRTVAGRTETVVLVINTVTGGITETWSPQAGQVIAGSAPVLSPDGSRLYVVTSVHHQDTNTYTAVVAAYSTAHGALIGTPVTVPGPRKGPLQVSADGTRLVQPVSLRDPSTGEWISALVVINSHTAAPVVV